MKELDTVATLTMTASEIRVRFTRSEKILGLARDITFPRAAVTEVSVHDDALAAVRGLRAPGLAIPGRRRVGTWRAPGRRAAVSVVAGTPAVRIELTGQKYDEVVISSTDAEEWAAALRRS
jgi:hypothetical protein